MKKDTQKIHVYTAFQQTLHGKTQSLDGGKRVFNMKIYSFNSEKKFDASFGIVGVIIYYYFQVSFYICFYENLKIYQ